MRKSRFSEEQITTARQVEPGAPVTPVERVAVKRLVLHEPQYGKRSLDRGVMSILVRNRPRPNEPTKQGASGRIPKNDRRVHVRHQRDGGCSQRIGYHDRQVAA
jgi:hypothetical protein